VRVFLVLPKPKDGEMSLSFVLATAEGQIHMLYD
jgi:hypothetical protein